jgi:hypothetical protein
LITCGDILVPVSSQPGTHNEASELHGPVVQAGSIGHVLMAGSARGDQLPVPRQLPLAVRDFTGRLEHLAALDAVALGAIESCRDPRHRARVLDTLGTSLCHTGDSAAAVERWREALSIMDELGDHRARDLRDRLHRLDAPHA